MYVVVTIDSLFNISFSLFLFELNLTYLYLIFAGIVMPIGLVFLIVYMIRSNAPEGMFYSIMQTLSKNKNDGYDSTNDAHDAASSDNSSHA
jgi:hypothetical protein